MTTFDDRESAFEAKFAHDADMMFRAEARRDNMLGLWAAGLLGKTGEAAAEYAMTVVAADMERPGPEDVIEKVVADLAGKASETEIRVKLVELMAVAKAQILSEL